MTVERLTAHKDDPTMNRPIFDPIVYMLMDAYKSDQDAKFDRQHRELKLKLQVERFWTLSKEEQLQLLTPDEFTTHTSSTKQSRRR